MGNNSISGINAGQINPGDGNSGVGKTVALATQKIDNIAGIQGGKFDLNNLDTQTGKLSFAAFNPLG